MDHAHHHKGISVWGWMDHRPWWWLPSKGKRKGCYWCYRYSSPYHRQICFSICGGLSCSWYRLLSGYASAFTDAYGWITCWISPAQRRLNFESQSYLWALPCHWRRRLNSLSCGYSKRNLSTKRKVKAKADPQQGFQLKFLIQSPTAPSYLIFADKSRILNCASGILIIKEIHSWKAYFIAWEAALRELLKREVRWNWVD